MRIQTFLTPPHTPPHHWKGANLNPSFVRNDFWRFPRIAPSPTSSVFCPHGLTGCAWPIGHARPKNLLVAHATNGFTHGRVGFFCEKCSLHRREAICPLGHLASNLVTRFGVEV